MHRAAILVTGFEPFNGDKLNPSWLIAQQLHGELIHGAAVRALQLPTVFDQALAVLREALRRQRPSLVLALGLAGGRAALSLERVAINVNDARIPDNAAAQPIDTPVLAGAPAAYFSTLPIKAMAVALRGADVPAEVSQTAGTFVCNHVFFGLMHTLRRRKGVRAGFMHVPYLPQQAAQHDTLGLPLDLMVQGVRLALATALVTQEDLRVAGGSIA